MVTEQKCETQSQCTDTPQCTTEQQCTTQEQCTTQTQVIPETTFTEECQDIVTNVCHEVQTEVRVAQHVVNHPSVVGVPALPAVQTAGLVAPAAAVGPLVGALGLNPSVIPARIAKREADAEADPQFFINGPGFGFGGRVGGVAGPVAPVGVAGVVAPAAVAPAAVAPVAVAPAAVAPVAVAPAAVAPVAVAPQCHQKVERQCRQVPVQTSRTVAVPVCVQVPVCVPVPKCVTVPHCVEVPVCVPVDRGNVLLSDI